MIFVDTSVWVDFFRGRDPALITRLRHLMDDEEIGLAAPVRIEILSGASRTDLSRLRRLLSAFALFVPSEPTWTRIDGWIEVAVAAGQRFGAADLLIAALAAEQDAPLWSLDTDFERMARLGFVRRY